jgi:hypothetical protein
MPFDNFSPTKTGAVDILLLTTVLHSRTVGELGFGGATVVVVVGATVVVVEATVVVVVEATVVVVVEAIVVVVLEATVVVVVEATVVVVLETGVTVTVLAVGESPFAFTAFK